MLLTYVLGFSQVEENFSDGDFTQNPVWIGTTENFIVNSDSILQLNISVADTSYLATDASAIKNAEWQVDIQINYNPSSSNYSLFVLTASNPELLSSTGYFVKVGNTADEISLYRNDSTKQVEIIDGLDDRVDMKPVNVSIKVTRDSAGLWSLYSKLSTETDYVLEGTAVDTTYMSSAYAGVLCKNSSTQGQSYFFDNIMITGEAYDLNSDTVSIDTIVIPQDTVVVDTILSNDTIVGDWLVYEDFSDGNFTENPIWNGTTENFIVNSDSVLQLNISEADTSYLSTNSTAIKNAEWYADIQINYNPSSSNYSLFVLTASNLDLLTSTGYFVKVGNTADEISLYRNDSTKQVEIIDGLDDRVDMKPVNVSIKVTCDSTGLWSLYSKLSTETDYILEGTVVDKTYMTSAYAGVLCKNSSTQGQSYFFDNIRIKGEKYDFIPSGSNISDTISKLETVEQGDLVINEILFNTSDVTEEFLEIYNKSEKLLSLSNLGYTTRRTDGTLNSVKKLPENAVIEPHAYLALCETPSVDSLYYGSIDGSKFTAMSSWQSMNNDGATIVICTHSKDTIFDELTYSPDWHHVLIKNEKDVSLERINPDLPTQSADSWHSASSDAFYATPGYENSQYRDLSEVQESSKSFWLENESFTPNNDGNNDVLLLKYKLPESGWMANITIFDVSGQIISRLYKSYLLAADGTLVWDGKADRGKLANIGIYVLYVELHNADKGEVKQYKIPCVLSGN